jgi:hypothetical protein
MANDIALVEEATRLLQDAGSRPSLETSARALRGIGYAVLAAVEVLRQQADPETMRANLMAALEAEEG